MVAGLAMVPATENAFGKAEKYPEISHRRYRKQWHDQGWRRRSTMRKLFLSGNVGYKNRHDVSACLRELMEGTKVIACFSQRRQAASGEG
jgi:hypothetical protein